MSALRSSALARALAAARARAKGWVTALAEAIALERAPRAVLDDVIAEKLSRLARHTATRTAFGRERFREAGIDPERVRAIGDLAGLRPLEKEELRTRGLDLVTDGRVDPAWMKNASGGSTGTPVTFYQDADYHRRMLADQARHLTWTGLPWWTPRAYAWGGRPRQPGPRESRRAPQGRPFRNSVPQHVSGEGR